ncbi:hypothetical protein C8F04DRAFT_1194725 [Mycena alexandri]|uniref:Uncharacterized protein n=1 Tax=Mycena alexandri TaxID=1745969 RepID=A0AAD6S6L1_9AGAR|nr:hypothetical protein C8F04DRAFT_1194725 [Mycena alexandri]
MFSGLQAPQIPRRYLGLLMIAGWSLGTADLKKIIDFPVISGARKHPQDKTDIFDIPAICGRFPGTAGSSLPPVLGERFWGFKIVAVSSHQSQNNPWLKFTYLKSALNLTKCREREFRWVPLGLPTCLLLVLDALKVSVHLLWKEDDMLTPPYNGMKSPNLAAKFLRRVGKQHCHPPDTAINAPNDAAV